MGMKKFSVEDIREILKVEVRKSILHSHHVNLGTNKYDPEKVEDSLKSVSIREVNMKQKLKDDLETYEGMLDEKLEKILLSLDKDYLQLYYLHFLQIFHFRSFVTIIRCNSVPPPLSN